MKPFVLASSHFVLREKFIWTFDYRVEAHDHVNSYASFIMAYNVYFFSNTTYDQLILNIIYGNT